MATQTELLNAIEVIKNHCHTQKEKYRGCKECLLRNSYENCGLFSVSDDDLFDSPREWETVKPETPKLFTY